MHVRYFVSYSAVSSPFVLCSGLCLLVRCGVQRKCDQYWPDTGLQLYGRVEVTVSEILHMSHFTLRTFLVTHKQVSPRSALEGKFEIDHSWE